jgi:pimeloyl-ACP methyl ester carboxylesterase
LDQSGRVTSHLLPVPGGAELTYSDQGRGPTILLLDVRSGSRRPFEHNVAGLSSDHRVVVLELGDAEPPVDGGGRPAAHAAREVRAVIEALGLAAVTAIGWSTASLVWWDYLDRFGGDHRLAGVVAVSPGPPDLTPAAGPAGVLSRRDHRNLIATLSVPHLLVWGRDEARARAASALSAEWLLDHLPSAEFHLFEASGEAPMWEQPEQFNAVVSAWMAR